MKNKYFIALLFVFVFGIVFNVSAQEQSVRVRMTATSSPARPIKLMATSTEMRVRLMATSTKPRMWLASTTVTSTRKTEMQEKRAEFKQDIAKRQVSNVARVISATIERLEKIIERVESRIEKLKANGGNTTESEGFLVSAQAHLSEAKADVEAFAELDLTSDRAQDNFEIIRVAASSAKEHIRLAHTDIMKAVRLLGQIQSSLRAATSTEETN